MEKLLLAVCLALVALGVGALPIEPEEPRAAGEPVGLDSEAENELSYVTPEENEVEEIELDAETKKQILDDYLDLAAPLGIEYIENLRHQIIPCQYWFGRENKHIEKFDVYEDGIKFDEVHKSIREADMSNVQWELYERRRKGDSFCYELYVNRTKETGSDEWDLPDEPPFDETLSVEFCAESHLNDSQAFKLPFEFKDWPRDEQKNYCEESQVNSIRLSKEGCDYQYRLYDYRQVFSEEQEERYQVFKKGFTTCQQFFDVEIDWSKEEAPPKEKSGGEPSDMASVEEKSSNEDSQE